MKTFIYLFIFSVFSLSPLQAQQWEWADNFNFEGTEYSPSIGGIDDEGNIYLTVMASSDYSYQPSAGYLLLKVNKKGELAWSKNINQYFQGRITSDSQGRTYLAYADKLACIDTDGNEIWKINSQGERGFGNVYLRNDHFIVTGTDYFGGDSTIGFIAEYSLNGELLSSVHCNVPKFGKGTLDKAGSFVLIHTDYPDPVTLSGGRLSKFDKTGKLSFMKVIPYYPTKINCDEQNNIFVMGEFGQETIEIDGVKYNAPERSVYQFLIKYDSQGQILWHKIIEGNLGGSSITHDQLGNFYYVVDFSAKIKIGDFGINHPTGGLLILKFDPQGKIIWNQFTPSYNTGPFGYLQPEKILASPNGDLFLSGRITGTLQFGNSLVQSSSDMYSELFVGKINQNNTVGLSKFNLFPEAAFSIHPNPSDGIFVINMDRQNQDLISITVFDVQGKRVFESRQEHPGQATTTKEINLSGQPKGIYFVEINGSTGRQVQKIVRD